MSHYQEIYPEFATRLHGALNEITPEVVEELLFDDNWRAFECGGWFAALKKWSDFDIPNGRTLVKRSNTCRLQGLSVALATFGTHYGATCLRGYFNATLRSEWSLGESWTLGALCHLDSKLGTHHADDYLVPLAHHAARVEARARNEQLPRLSSASPWDETIVEFQRMMQWLEDFSTKDA